MSITEPYDPVIEEIIARHSSPTNTPTAPRLVRRCIDSDDEYRATWEKRFSGKDAVQRSRLVRQSLNLSSPRQYSSPNSDSTVLRKPRRFPSSVTTTPDHVITGKYVAHKRRSLQSLSPDSNEPDGISFRESIIPRRTKSLRSLAPDDDRSRERILQDIRFKGEALRRNTTSTHSSQSSPTSPRSLAKFDELETAIFGSPISVSSDQAQSFQFPSTSSDQLQPHSRTSSILTDKAPDTVARNRKPCANPVIDATQSSTCDSALDQQLSWIEVVAFVMTSMVLSVLRFVLGHLKENFQGVDIVQHLYLGCLWGILTVILVQFGARMATAKTYKGFMTGLGMMFGLMYQVF